MTSESQQIQNKKFVSVLIVEQSLDAAGIIANAAFVLGLTAGKLLPQETFGPDTIDGDGSTHKFLTNIGHYVRKAGQAKLRTLRNTFVNSAETSVIDYTEDAAPADYSVYASNLKEHSGEQISYRAIHVYGPEEVVVPLTKNLSRL
jgi:hypothetical protein